MPRAVVRDRTGSMRCALCHDALGPSTCACPSCGSVVHLDCRAELARCPTLACPGVRRRVVHVREGAPRIPLFRALGQVLAAAGLILLALVGLAVGLVVFVRTGCSCPDHDPERWSYDRSGVISSAGR